MTTLSAPRSQWLHRFAWFTTVATLFLICSGGMVTSKGVGLAVPDWPTTFGYNMFLFPVSRWVGGIFFEHVHRLIASTVGFLTIILAIWLWRIESRPWVRNLGFAALGAVVLQGVLGGLRVTMLKDEIGIFHACLAQAFLGMLVLIALATSPFWARLLFADSLSLIQNVSRVAIVTTAIIYLQLALGATMRHEHRDLAILDFPLAYGKILPVLSADELARANAWRETRAFSEVTRWQIWLQMTHRLVAVVIAAGVTSVWFHVRKSMRATVPLRWFTDVWAFLLLCQVTLGAWTIWSNKAADIATAHVALGATMLGLGIAISAISLRLASLNVTPSLPHESFVDERIKIS